MTSACDGSLTHGVLFNLTWASQCAPVAVDTTPLAASLFVTERPFFVVNARTAPTVVVRVVNPEPMASPWSLVDGKFTVKPAVSRRRRADDVPRLAAAGVDERMARGAVVQEHGQRLLCVMLGVYGGALLSRRR